MSSSSSSLSLFSAAAATAAGAPAGAALQVGREVSGEVGKEWKVMLGKSR